MRLVIHAGTHKTATTAFQEICYQNRSVLEGHGVHYPEWEKRKNHGFLALCLRQGQLSYIEKLLARQVRGRDPQDTILLSGEGLERCFIDVKMAFDLENIARRAGIGKVEWVVVERQPFDYFQSLYAELSKQLLAMNYLEMAESILKHGFLSASCRYYDYMFVFDGNKFYREFSKRLGLTLTVFPFSKFAAGYPGQVLLEDTLGLKTISSALSFPADRQTNARLSAWDVEFRYVCNFLGVRPTPMVYEADKPLFDGLILPRLTQIAQNDDAIRQRFRKRFHFNTYRSLRARLRGG